MINTSQQATSTNLAPKYEPVKRTPREQCKIDGGVWDEKTQTCLRAGESKDPAKITIPKKDVEPPKLNVKQEGIEIGDIKGTSKQTATLPDGRQFFGLSLDDIDLLKQQEAAKKARLEGTAPLGTAQAQAEEQARLQQSIGQIGQIGQLTEAEQAKINYSQALTAGTVGQIPSLLSTAGQFAVGGAIAGGAGGAGIGAVPGALIGAGVGIIAGIARGVLGNIKEQQRGELQAADIELTNARTNMRQLAMLASQDRANADIYINAYNNQLTRIHQARRQTKAEVQGDLNSFMEDGREQLADFDAFLQDGGIADVYGQKLRIALQTDTPLSFEGTELMNLE